MVAHGFTDARLAALYDSLYPRTHNRDFDFYLPMILAAQAVLDVGCGTGALLHEARQLGHKGRLCGLDPAAGMLKQARQRTDIEWVLGDLRTVHFEREFDLAVMTGHTFQVLVEDAELRAGLAAIREALTLGGRFAFETRNPAARPWEKWTQEAVVVDEQGASVRVSRQVDVPFDGRVVSFTETFSSPKWDRPEVSRSTLRFLDAERLCFLLAEGGFEIEQQFGDWDRQPLSPGCPEIITVARVSRP
jgi:SAM-dependent methyltransferase